MKEIKQVKKDKKAKKIFGRMMQVLLALILIIILLCCFRCGRGDAPANGEYEENVNAITEIDYSERQEAVDTIVEKGKMNVNYSPKAVFEGKDSVLFNVKNIKNNHAPIVFTIYDENETCIYESKKIQPGYEMNSIRLEEQLSSGIHDCSIKIGYAEEGNVSSVFPLSIEVR